MKQLNFCILVLLTSALAVTSCKKKDDSTNISTPPLQIGAVVDDSKPLCGSVKGTMLSGKTYNIGCDITVNAGDTLLIQSGVHVNVTGNYTIAVKGVLISLGTKDAPNWITVPGVTKTDAASADPSVDPAFAGKWPGIACDTGCKLLVIKWTHIEFAGGNWTSALVANTTAGSNGRPILFQNPNGVFILEDSWIYGNIDDAVRITSGKFSIMRNTLEKNGYQGGDVFNAKSGSVGDMAYNLFIGTATNGTKASNKGGTNPQTNINMYNNTYVNGGYRQIQTGRAGGLNYEEGAYGMFYNNLLVNCKYGVRVVNNPIADTAKMKYGNTFQYHDSVSGVNQFYPTGYITVPRSTDVPDPSTFLPAGYTLGGIYNAPQLVGKNDPQFVNYKLPATGVMNINYASGWDFHLKSASPCINKGYTNFTPLAVVPVDPNFGATEITKPGKDIGCYQSDGTGNQH